MSSLPSYAQDLGDGIVAIDTGFHRPVFDAAYLIVENGRAAFVDTGTHYALPRLLGALDALGLPREAVDWVIPTHVHLDHAGGAGLLMRELPAAKLVVHPRGARHLIDPSKPIAGARSIADSGPASRPAKGARPSVSPSPRSSGSPKPLRNAMRSPSARTRRTKPTRSALRPAVFPLNHATTPA